MFQVVHPKLYQNFPALRELEATPNNLPQQLTSFVGREREREEIEEMLGGTRLLTLLGMGGLGKTRLSLQIGTSVMDEYPDGVWFIDLQTIRDDSLVVSETARVLGVREEPGRPLMQTLTAHLKSRKLMLILDNCEQVIDTCADLANALLRGAPEVRILATSRIALRVPGEQTYVVQPLPVPMRTAGLGGAVAIAGGAAVRRAGEAAQAELCADRERGAGGGGAGVPPGGHSAGAGACGSARALAVGRRHQQAAERSLQDPDRRRPDAAGAAADAARAGRLVVRPAGGERAGAAGAAVGVCGRLRAGGGGNDLWRRSRSIQRTCST